MSVSRWVPGLVVRRCRLSDIAPLSQLLKLCWHSAYDRMLGPDEAAHLGRYLHSPFWIGLLIASSTVSPRSKRTLVAACNDQLIGHAMAERDGPEIILYSLYTHPDWQGKGVGSVLLETVVGAWPDAKAIRLEVLKDNAAAIAWYQAKGFAVYGETPHATGTVNVASLYMDKQLGVCPEPVPAIARRASRA